MDRSDLRRNLRLMLVLTSANLKARYRYTFYGFLWVLLNPILTYAAQVFAFTTIFQVKFEHYPLYLLAGLFPWLFVVQSVEMCTGIFVNNSAVIKNIPIPPVLLVLIQILDNFINFICAFLVLIIYFCFFYSLNPMTILYILVPLVPLLITTSSMCLIFAIINVRFRDFKFIVSFIFSLLFYLTPIFYNAALVPEKVRWIITSNPFYYLIRPFQQILVSNGEAPFVYNVGVATGLAFLILSAAVIYWSKMKKYLVFYV